jgi:hypothetical protein
VATGTNEQFLRGNIEHLNAAIHAQDALNRPGPFPVQSCFYLAVERRAVLTEAGNVHHFSQVHKNNRTVNTPGSHAQNEQSPQEATHR